MPNYGEYIQRMSITTQKQTVLVNCPVMSDMIPTSRGYSSSSVFLINDVICLILHRGKMLSAILLSKQGHDTLIAKICPEAQ